MSKKAGVYILNWGTVNLDVLCECYPAVIVSMDTNDIMLKAFRDRCPNTFILGRTYDGGEDNGFPKSDDNDQHYMEPRKSADLTWQRIQGDVGKVLPYVDAYMIANENGVWDAERARLFNEYQLYMTDYFHNAGMKYAALSFSTGHPEIALYDHLHESMRAADLIALHEYGSPTMAQDTQEDGTGWFCLRYRKIYAELPDDLKTKPLLISENGIDGGTSANPRHGWQAYCGEAEYAAQLDWYSNELNKDAFVIGHTIFSWNPWPEDDPGRGTFGIDAASGIHAWLRSQGTPEKFRLDKGAFGPGAPEVDPHV